MMVKEYLHGKEIDSNTCEGRKDETSISTNTAKETAVPILRTSTDTTFQTTTVTKSFDLLPNHLGVINGSGASKGDGCVGCRHKNDPEGMYPRDCYSFIALGPWNHCHQSQQGSETSTFSYFHNVQNLKLSFLYGFFVFGIQMSFLILMCLSKMARSMSAIEDVDNPSKDFGMLALFIPANNTIIVHVTQWAALFAFLFFADDSLNDFAEAIEQFPSTSLYKQPQLPQPRQEEESSIFWARISCICKGVQGLLACLTVILLVMTSSDVIEIVLNFTAVNFISTFDNAAFALAREGRYGDALKDESKEIEKKPLPMCRQRGKWKHITPYLWALILLSLTFATLAATILSKQQSHQVWNTQMLRVQFDQSSGLQDYNGCYQAGRREGNHTNYQRNKDRRTIYTSYKNTTNTRLEYCKEERRWVFFAVNETSDAITDPCNAGEMELARSSLTNAFDVSTAFEIQWLSPFNKPLNVYFLESNQKDDPDKIYESDSFFCDADVDDGVCDENLNKFDFQFDGGDCCATTCDHPDCKLEELEFAFEQRVRDIRRFHTDFVAEGFQRCKDQSMEGVFTTINKFRFQDRPAWSGRVSIEEIPWRPVLELDCDEKDVFKIPITTSMEGKIQPAKVGKQSDCVLTVQYFEPAMNLEVSVDDSKLDSNVRVLLKNKIPTAIGLLTNAPVLNLYYQNLTGTIPQEIGLLNQTLTGMDLRGNLLTGSIPVAITSLNRTTVLNLKDNMLKGTIPSTIGSLQNLTLLDLSNNHLTGDIPKGIEGLTKLTSIDLSGNNLRGSIDCGKFNMTANQTEACRILNDYSPVITDPPSISPAPTTNPPVSSSPSATPTVQTSTTDPPTKISSSSISSKLSDAELPSFSPTEEPTPWLSQPPTSCESDSIVNLLCDDDLDFNLTIFCDLIQNETGDDLFSKVPLSNWTIFAPVDEAFDESLEGLSDEDILYLVTFHVVNETRTSESFHCKSSNGDNRNVITMWNGKDTRTRCFEDEQTPKGIRGLGNNGRLSEFLELDIKACNGVIHIIDGILLPPRWEHTTTAIASDPMEIRYVIPSWNLFD